tara:strand:+ start:396 stop:2114 length:1719 start_codon:yes stop_codon:yes gene_type:complete
MPDYGLTKDSFINISGSAYLFQSGTLQDNTTAQSASIPQIIAITCSANNNNILTRLTNLGSYATINLSSGSRGTNPTTLVLRYISSGSNQPTSLQYTTSGNIRYVDIPLKNNDDGFTVAYKTVKSINNQPSPFYTASLDEEIGGIGNSDITGDGGIGFSAILDGFVVGEYLQPAGGSGSFIIGNFSSYKNLYHLSSSLGQNMAIGNSFKIRKGGGIGDSAISDGFVVGEYPVIGKFLLHNLNSGSTSTPDFSGTKPEIGGMEIGSNFKIGESTPLFLYNITQSGSGAYNQKFSPGNFSINSASMGLILDPDDKGSGIITGSGDTKLYMSSSGRFGFNTTDPQSDFDIAADKFQVRAKRDSRGIFINEEGNLESFNKTTAGAATGSEFIMSYSRGGAANVTAQMIAVVLFGASNPGFDGYDQDLQAQEETNQLIAEHGGLATFIQEYNPGVIAEATHFGEKLGILGTNAQADDILGSVRWMADSGSFDSKYFDNRGSGEMLKIQGRVSEATTAGIKGDMIFYATTEVANAPIEIMRIASDGNVHITGSLKISGTVDSVGVDTDDTSTIDGGSF